MNVSINLRCTALTYCGFPSTFLNLVSRGAIRCEPNQDENEEVENQ